ncbi:hypothetical protein YC2023_033824 [Brassica napus]
MESHRVLFLDIYDGREWDEWDEWWERYENMLKYNMLKIWLLVSNNSVEDLTWYNHPKNGLLLLLLFPDSGL